MPVDCEELTLIIENRLRCLQAHYRLNDRDMTGMVLSLGVKCFMRDMASRQLNGHKTPYLAAFHLRQGVKYYQENLKSETQVSKQGQSSLLPKSA